MTDNLTVTPESQKKPEQKPKGGGLAKWLIALLFVALVVMVWLFMRAQGGDNEIETVTREGVVTQIQELSRLQTVTYSVDTVITSERPGNWYNLWQDQQKGLFIAHGRVNAGIDLSQLSEEMVQVSQVQIEGEPMPQVTIDITLPPSEIFTVYLDDIEVYDWQTGVFGMFKADPEVLAQAQSYAKAEVLSKACQGDVLNLALQNAEEQVQRLFEMTGATVTVQNQGTGACQVAS